MCFVVFLLQCLVINICLRFLLIPQTQTKRQHITMGFRLCYIYSFNICNNMPSWCGFCCCCSSFVLLNRPLTGLTWKKDNRVKKKYWPLFLQQKYTSHTDGKLLRGRYERREKKRKGQEWRKKDLIALSSYKNSIGNDLNRLNISYR